MGMEFLSAPPKTPWQQPQISHANKIHKRRKKKCTARAVYRVRWGKTNPDISSRNSQLAFFHFTPLVIKCSCHSVFNIRQLHVNNMILLSHSWRYFLTMSLHTMLGVHYFPLTKPAVVWSFTRACFCRSFG